MGRHLKLKHKRVDRYEDYRAAFRRQIQKLRQTYSIVEAQSHPLEHDPSLTMESVYFGQLKHPEKLLVLTAGLHGIEGYVGAELIERFLEQQLPLIKNESTGVLLVNFINPWGMKYHRRVNEDQIDLNRNCLFEAGEERSASFRAADSLRKFLSGDFIKSHHFGDSLRFYSKAAMLAIAYGASDLKAAILAGQGEEASLPYYCGKEQTKQIGKLLALLEDYFQRTSSTSVLIDLHTGYGPRYHMSMVNPVSEKVPGVDWQRDFQYGRVVSGHLSEQIRASGDFVEYVHRRWVQSEKEAFATCFEFGTNGGGIFRELSGLQTVLLENGLHKGIITDEAYAQIIKNRWMELYRPTDEEWWEKAYLDFDLGMKGIIKHFAL